MNLKLPHKTDTAKSPEKLRGTAIPGKCFETMRIPIPTIVEVTTADFLYITCEQMNDPWESDPFMIQFDFTSLNNCKQYLLIAGWGG